MFTANITESCLIVKTSRFGLNYVTDKLHLTSIIILGHRCQWDKNKQYSGHVKIICEIVQLVLLRLCET